MVYAYLVGHPRREAPKMEIPLHTVIKVRACAGWRARRARPRSTRRRCSRVAAQISWDGWQHVTEERYEMPNQKLVGDDGQTF